MQRQQSLYNGTFDAFRKIVRTEGPRGLYRGFHVNSLAVLNSQLYVLYAHFRMALLSLISPADTSQCMN